MYEELIKSLREDHGKQYFARDMEAADASEELVRKEKFHAFLWNIIQPNEMEAYLSIYNAGSEKEES